MQLENKNIIITGASSGIGAEFARTASAQGANVIMIARSEEKLKAVQESLKGKGVFYSQDLTHIDEIKLLVEKIVEENGRIDGLVHCAGTSIIMPVKAFKYETMHEEMLLNLYSFIELVKNVSKKKHFSAEGGSIIAISSIASQRGIKGKVSYCSSKAALDGAVRVMAAELASRRIRVNTITPGFVKTQMFEKYLERHGEEGAAAERAKQPLGLVEAAEVAKAGLFLLSESSEYITGTTITVDSGRLNID